MSLITAKKTNHKEKIKLELDQDIFSKINQYCEWAGISNIDHFFEEAATYIFLKDKDWIKHLKSNNKEAV